MPSKKCHLSEADQLEIAARWRFYVTSRGGKGESKIAKEEGITRHAARMIVRLLMDSTEAAPEEATEQREYSRKPGSMGAPGDREEEVDTKKGTLSVRVVTTSEARTPEQMAEATGVDLERWKPVRFKQTSWPTTARICTYDEKGRKLSEKMEQEHNFLLSVTYEERILERVATEAVDAILERIAIGATPVIAARGFSGGLLAVPHMPDAHIGVIAQGWSLQQAHDRFLDALYSMLERARKVGGIEQVMLPLGHDLMQIDQQSFTKKGTLTTTSSGTVVGSHGYPSVFAFAESAGSEAIKMCAGIAPVEVKIVHGNHDETSSFGLGRVWQKEFATSSGVHVSNRSFMAPADFHRFGDVGFMLTHGKDISWNDLAAYFSQAGGEAWNGTKQREVLTGHLHSSRTRPVGFAQTDGVVTMRISPSLCPLDYYHRKAGYRPTVSAAETFIYDRTYGLVDTIRHSYLPHDEPNTPAFDLPEPWQPKAQPR